MLILSRKIGESIKIGENITVMVCKIECDVIKLGIVADKEIPVHRGEVFERIKRGQGDGTTNANQ